MFVLFYLGNSSISFAFRFSIPRCYLNYAYMYDGNTLYLWEIKNLWWLMKVRNTHRITTKHGNFITLVMVITWFGLGDVLLETVILKNFLLKIRMCFFKVKHYFGHISGMVGLIDGKRKGSASVGCWYNMWPWPLASLMTLTLDVSRSNFEIAVSQELLVWLMWNEEEES